MIVHILTPINDNCPSSKSTRERMIIKNIANQSKWKTGTRTGVAKHGLLIISRTCIWLSCGDWLFFFFFFLSVCFLIRRNLVLKIVEIFKVRPKCDNTPMWTSYHFFNHNAIIGKHIKLKAKVVGWYFLFILPFSDSWHIWQNFM